MNGSARLLAHLSHELRAPLGVIRGYLRLLEQGGAALDERQLKAVVAALEASGRAVTLVEEASELSRLLSGDAVFRKATLPLSSLLHASIQAVELPEEPAVDLDVVEASNVIVSVDEARMRSALAALLTAIVRTQSRPVTVQVTATRLRVKGRLAARVIVAPWTVSRLRARELPFDAARGGQGLQLAIAAAVIEAHGGRVSERNLGNRPAGLVVRLPALR
jgi:two-component system, OmpR family, sensor kinase